MRKSILTDYAVAPGEFIEEWLEENGAVRKDGLATHMGMTAEELDSLLSGETALTEDIAAKLAHVTAIPARIWLKYEATYRDDLIRLARGDDEAFKEKVEQVVTASIDRMTKAADLLRQAAELLEPLESFEPVIYFDYQIDTIRETGESLAKEAESIRPMVNPTYVKNLATGNLGVYVSSMSEDEFPKL